MTQTRRSKPFKIALGRRLQKLVEQHLKLSWTTLSARLGYKNSSVLRRARDGKTLLSAEKLAALAEVSFDGDRKRISIDWLLTGEGQPLCQRGALDADGPASALADRVRHASVDTREKIAAFLEITEASESAAPARPDRSS